MTAFLLSLYDRFVVEVLQWQRPEAFDYFATAIAVVGLGAYMCVDAFTRVMRWFGRRGRRPS